MDWKVRLDGEENTFKELQRLNNPNAKIIRDGLEWFIESAEFSMLADHREVKQKAAAIVSSILGSGAVSGATISMGPVYRIHYDNSKTVYRDD